MKTLKKIIPILILFACIRANAEVSVSLQDSVSLQGREEASLLSVGDMTNSQFIEYNINIANGLYPDPTLVEREWTAGDGISADLIPAIIDDNPIVPNEANIDTTAIVGQIEIESGVSQYGSKTYRVPIKVPKGIREEVTPEISLDYDSHNVNLGILGHGWRLSGVPQIERTAKILEIDNITSGIEMNLEDAFSIDGMRLIEENRADDYIVYESLRGNIKAKAYISNNVITHFDVWYPDGRRSRFGYETTSENRLTYPIVWLKDEFGNTISYDYLIGNSDYLIKKITYSNCDITFDYENIDARDLRYSTKYISGIQIDSPQILKTITTKIGGTKVRQYKIDYELQSYYFPMPVNIRCLIAEEELNPLKFYYGSSDTGGAGIVKLEKGLDFSYNGDYRPNVSKGFIDNGGKEGLIVWPNKVSYWRLKRENSASPNPGVYADLLTDACMNMYSGEENILVYTGLENATTDKLPQIKTELGFIDILTADIDGCGQESIIRINNMAVNGRDIVTFNVWKKGETDTLEHVCAQTFDTGASRIDISGNESVRPKYFHVGNFLGDGKMRIVAFAGVEITNIYPRDMSPGLIYLFDIESGTYESIYGTLYHHVSYPSHEQPNKEEAYRKSDRIIVMDCNNDGKDEICTITEDGFYIYEIKQSIDEEQLVEKSCVQKTFDERINLELINNRDMSIGDFNGDGYPDIFIGAHDDCEEILERSSFIYYSKGNGEFEKKNLDEKLYTCIAYDNNNDGITDLISIYQDCIQVNEITNDEVFRYTIALFDAENQMLVPANTTNQENGHNINLLGIDFKNSRAIKYESDENFLDNIKCTGMVNSLGVVEENHYLRIGVGNDAGFYSVTDSLAHYPNMAIHQGLMPIERTLCIVGGDTISSHNYSYNTAEVNLRGLGFMGFRQIVSTDHNGDIIKHNYDTDNFSVLISEITPTQAKSYSWTALWRTINDATEAKVLNLNLTSTTEKDLTTDYITRHAYNYDAHGNRVGYTRTDADNFVTRQTNTFRNVTTLDDGYVIGLPVQQNISRIPYGASAITETTYISYIGTQPKTIIYRNNSALISTHLYGYNDNGLLVADTLINGSSTKRHVQRYERDSQGRIINSTDPTGLTSSFSYNNDGSLYTSTTPTGVVTTYNYDELGRVTQVSDGENIIQTHYAWADSIGVYCIEQHSSSSPTIIAWHDALSREICKGEIRHDGSMLKVSTEYDSHSRISHQTLPYKDPSSRKWITYHYDNYGRLLRRQEPSGRNLRHTYSGHSITTIEDNISTIRTYDPRGNLISVTDQSGALTYTYAADGLPTRIVSSTGATTIIGYDTSRRRISLNDPSFGLTTYQYDADGNLAKETDANSRIITYGYDVHNRLIGKTTPEFSSSYNYDSYNRLVNITSTNGTRNTYNYDTRNRITQQSEIAGSVTYRRDYAYSEGRLQAVNHISSKSGAIATEMFEYSHNHLKQVFSVTSQGDTITVWKLVKENDLGQPICTKSGTITHQTDYDPYGVILSQKSYSPFQFVNPDIPVVGPIVPQGGEEINGMITPPSTPITNIIRHISYNFDNNTGNLLSREDCTRQLGVEAFTYDNMNRLLTSPEQSVSYSSLGNITAKSDLGVYSYANNSRPYAVTSVDLAQSAETPSALNIVYTSFRRPQQIVATHEAQQIAESYVYNAFYDKVQTTHTKRSALSSAPTTSVLYTLGGCYEREGASERLWLGGGYYGAPVVLEVTDTMSYRYVMRDHLGSITHVYTAEPIPTQLQELSYDAWGRLRNPDTHEAYTSDSMPTPILGRGYTGHRHIAGIGLIDMNARLYDPMLGRFLSPDPHIQSPDCPQNYNRYTYCLNNPLRYTDPTGEVFTPRMQAYVNRFVQSVNNRLWDLMKQLVKLMARSDTKPETIQKMEDDINECIDILTEINMLSESSQVYDIFCYDEESLLTVFKIPLNQYGYVTFSESLGIIIVEFFNGGENNIGLFAHELKHAYQFEVGEYSIGKPIADKQYPNLLYDRTDEYAAYERQNLFIDVEKNKYTKEDIDVSVLYVKLTKNIASYNTMEMFIYNINNIDNLWHFAKRYSHAFRINGVTYYPR